MNRIDISGADSADIDGNGEDMLDDKLLKDGGGKGGTGYTSDPPCNSGGAHTGSLETYIYRRNGTNPGNLTPKPKDASTGLSFTTKPERGAAQTTIEAVNATGILKAVQDGVYHVSITPVNATVLDWISAGPGSIWTLALKDIVHKVR